MIEEPISSSKTKFEGFYIILWGIMAAVIIFLFWVGTSNKYSTNHLSGKDESAGAENDRAIKDVSNTAEEEANKTIEDYAISISSGDKRSAMSHWKTPSKKLSRMIDNIHSIKILSVKSKVNNRRSSVSSGN